MSLCAKTQSNHPVGSSPFLKSPVDLKMKTVTYRAALHLFARLGSSSPMHVDSELCAGMWPKKVHIQQAENEYVFRPLVWKLSSSPGSKPLSEAQLSSSDSESVAMSKHCLALHRQGMLA